jgi:hypothetical protein
MNKEWREKILVFLKNNPQHEDGILIMSKQRNQSSVFYRHGRFYEGELAKVHPNIPRIYEEDVFKRF